MIYKVEGAKTLNTMAGSLWGKALMGLQYAAQKRGPLTMAPSQLGAFARSGPEQARANLEYHVQPLSLEKFGRSEEHTSELQSIISTSYAVFCWKTKNKD